MVLAAQGLKTKAGEHAPAPPPLQTERKVEKGPLFAHNDPPHKNPGYGPDRTSTFRDMLRKRIVHGRPNGPTARRPNAATSSFSPLRPCVLNSE